MYRGSPRPRRHCVRWGPCSPSPKEAPFQFSAHVYCGQTAGCIKMALSTEVGVGPDHIVLDGDPAPLPKKGAGPQFSAGCIMMLLGMEVRLSPGDFVSDGDPAPSPQKGAEPPIFRPTSIVAKRLHGSRCHLVRW